MMVDPPKVAATQPNASPPADATTTWETPAALVAHIVEHHHTYARAAIARLAPLALEVNRLHGDEHPELAEVMRRFELVRVELEPHMRAEEGSLFPAIIQMARPACNARHREALRLSIVVLEHDHDTIARALRGLREAMEKFVLPETAPAELRAFSAGIAAFADNLDEHMRLEDELLLPQAQRAP
jgi:regulator of cell morphogenesis and NO signaling